MKKIMDNLRIYKMFNRKLFTFNLIIVILGIIGGSVFTFFLTEGDRTLVYNSLNDFFSNLNGNINYLNCFKESISNNLFYVILIWILGISLVGVLIIIPILYFKSFTLGFTISSIISKYGFKGIITSILYVFPHLIINLYIMLYLSLFAITLSIRIIKSFIGKRNIDFKIIFNKYIILLAISILVIFISSLYETFIIPFIFKSMGNLLI